MFKLPCFFSVLLELIHLVSTILCLGQGNIDPTVNNPCSHVCCAGCISERKSLDQGCGATQNSLAQHKVLCFDLETDRKDGEECSDIDVPYLQSKGTICCNKFHDSPGQHCCGTELYNPHREICCNGHRHSKEENKRCCGVQAYDIKNKQKKCCAGTLYHLSSKISAHEAQCCGSSLQKSSDICCSNEHKEVLYLAKTGFRCCGHLYYNTSLWSCCAGKLSPVHKPGQRHGRSIKEPRLVSMSNLNEEDLCKEMFIGTVDSVSLHSIVFSSVFKIFGRNATVIHLPSTHVLRAPDHCNSPKLILGKTCFFDQVHVFTDFTHDSLHQSLHFIISKCYRP
ncbi:galaxin-2-like [Labrus mixtus]|uniref:galaxin-2-like n=1 Tax=Labrus mixtus TaxID=508554 RepID=UPI0029C0262A|nr:galaxin-2-like [Labrus mixtus]